MHRIALWLGLKRSCDAINSPRLASPHNTSRHFTFLSFSGLPVRQNPKIGAFYVQGLKFVAVGSYKEIEARTEEGTANRTVACTQMNATSSRAHTVVTIQFDQIDKNDGKRLCFSEMCSFCTQLIIDLKT